VTKEASTASALWDVERDPAERINLAAGHPPLVAELEALGRQLRDRSIGRHTPPMKDDVMQRLKAIGYISPDATR
jgi:hypothetical protein